jgi:preprotein translocase subunit SecY
MFEKLRVVFTIPELRQKILLTLLMLAIYRVGYWIPVPIVDQQAVSKFFETEQGQQSEPSHNLRFGDHALHLGIDHPADSR